MKSNKNKCRMRTLIFLFTNEKSREPMCHIRLSWNFRSSCLHHFCTKIFLSFFVKSEMAN